MRLGIVLNSNDAETVWNGFRLGLVALDQRHRVNVFLLGNGVESEEIRDEKFNVQKEIERFRSMGGRVLACGTCMEIRDKKEGVCTVSSMLDLLKIIEESDKIVTLG